MKIHSIFGGTEFPLYSHYTLCPTAHFVGGVSRYLCECKEHHKCPGVLAASQDVYEIEKSLYTGISMAHSVAF